MKVWTLIYVGYEETDTLGIYTSRQNAIYDFNQFIRNDSKKRKDRYRIIEWETDKWNGWGFESWDDEAKIDLT